MADLLADQTSAELSTWFEYLRMDDQIRADWVTFAIIKAFNGDGKGKAKRQAAIDDDDEEIIDTTAPEFAEHFKGFINVPGSQGRRPRPQQAKSTQILMG